MHYQIGDKVKSTPIGKKEAFEGVVEQQVGADIYHVRDKNGHLWHLTSNELQTSGSLTTEQ